MTGPRSDDTPTDPPATGGVPALSADRAGRAEGAAEPEEEYLEIGLDGAPEEDLHQSFATTALWVLVGALVIAGGAIWAAPKIAPHVPAPIARFLAPAPEGLVAEVDALRDALEAERRRTEAALSTFGTRLAEIAGTADAIDPERIAALGREVGALREALADTADTAEAARATAGRAGETADAAAETARRAETIAESAAVSASAAIENSADAGALARRAADSATEAGRTASDALAATASLDRTVGPIEDSVGALGEELAAIRDTLSGAVQGQDTPSDAEIAAALRSLQARVQSLDARQASGEELSGKEAALLARRDALEALATETRDRIETLTGEIAALETRLGQRISGLAADLSAIDGEIETLDTRVDEAQATAQSARREALREAEDALRNAALRGAADALSSRVASGEPYAAILSEVGALIGQEAPPVLLAHAGGGVPPVTELLARFPAASRAALEAEAREGEDGAPGARIASWLNSQVLSRPIGEREGDSLPARLSRIEARLAEDELAAAQAEALALPPVAARAMSDWISDLSARVEADAALAAFLAPIFVSE